MAVSDFQTLMEQRVKPNAEPDDALISQPLLHRGYANR